MDEARNMALLFFVDHLMLKGGQRTIHDLSCQFGARGFTEEMRQDYAAEAVQFFVKKLEKFGPELQIKSLLGHRSQAAPEIRLVSGRHLKEFAEFLASQIDHFVVEGDRVRLANMSEPKTCPDEFVDEEGRPLAGHKAKLAAIEFMKSVLEQNEEQPYPLDLFYKKFCEHFPHHIRQEVATNPKELLMFLKLNRHLFFIRSNKVQLVKNRIPTSEEQQDSESGRSTEDIGGGGGNTTGSSSSSSERSNVASPEDAVASLKSDLEAASPNDPSNFLVVDFKLVCLGGGSHHTPSEQFVALVIVATPLTNKKSQQQGQLIVFDLAHCEGILTDKGSLGELLESDKITKVTHDVRRAAWLLGQRYGIEIKNVFDTQIAHSVIQHHKFGKPMGELRAISFVNLQRVYNPQSLVLSDISPRKLSQTPNWADRPVSPDILLSACEESHCLANGIYRPPGIRRRGSIQPPSLLNGGSPLGSPLFGNPPFNGGGYIPPPLRKVSAPMAAQSLMGQCRSPTIRNVFGGFPIPTTQNQKCEMRDAETQTISTGEIAVLKAIKIENIETNKEEKQFLNEREEEKQNKDSVGDTILEGNESV
uniref:3'-5' exonuclease domain-containing protein n=1 Tax=Meloidogyne javanica TaxID=6303 RepID=A0A915LIF6_MELJA